MLLPALIWLAVRLLPAPVLADCRRQAEEWMQAQGRKPHSPFGIALTVCVRLACGLAVWMVWKRQKGHFGPSRKSTQRGQSLSMPSLPAAEFFAPETDTNLPALPKPNAGMLT